MMSDAYDGIIDSLREENMRLKPFRDMAYHMASKRQDTVDDYIRIAKQAIADYESISNLYALNPDLGRKL